MNTDTPRLRKDLEIIPGQVRGRQVFVIRDGLGLIENPVAVTREMLALMGRLDGHTTLADLQLALTRQQGGVLVMHDELERIVRLLDEALLLENDRYEEARKRLIDEFARSNIRRPVLAGQSYPSGERELRQYLDKILPRSAKTAMEGRPVAVVAPHIDLKVAEQAYAAGYKPLMGTKPERVIVLGTGHSMEQGMFCVTEKDFETPLGKIRNDRESVGELTQAGKGCLAGGDFPHRREHSIEIQLIFLQHAIGRSDFRLVPVLCGSIVPHLLGKTRPGRVSGESEFVSILRKLAADPATLVVAGVDFSHIGLKFGDPNPAAALTAETQIHDNRLINAVCRRDADAFWQEMERTGDRFHVCGASSLACLLEILPPCQGKLLDYDMWHEVQTQSAVSFASILFWEDRKKPGKRTA